MRSCNESIELELYWIVVQYGLGSKILHTAKRQGIAGGTVMIGTGTVNCRYLEVFDLCETRREILLLLAEKQLGRKAIQMISREFHFEKPNHGIAFSTSVSSLFGSGSWCPDSVISTQSEVKVMHQVIMVIVEKGKADDVMDIANQAGGSGGTILNARGSGLHETKKFFSIEIEPEREIVMIIAETEKVEAITSAIRRDMQMDSPGHGLLFVQDVHQTIGLYPAE